jgi:hypothetical protein
MTIENKRAQVAKRVASRHVMEDVAYQVIESNKREREVHGTKTILDQSV